MLSPVSEPNLHRNNAAEWVLWVILLPVVPVAWAWEKVATIRRSRD